MSRLLLIAAAAGLWVAAPAQAAAPAARTATKQLDPAALKAADRLLSAMDYDGMMRRTCDAMVEKMGPMLKSSIESKTGVTVDDALIGRIAAIQSDFMRSAVSTPNLRRAVATIYANHFTAAELDRLARLYQDPVMRKWTDATPSVSAEMLPLISGVVESQRDALEQKIKAVVTDYYSQKGEGPTS